MIARSAPWLLLIVLLCATWYAYAPGLRGAFLFDDYANLPSLGAFGPVDNWTTLWRYLTSGFADPIGRPLALLSFLVDAHDWPAAAEPFKRTNVLLHLAIGALLARLLFKLGVYAGRERRNSAMAAVLAAGAWLLHPLWISTTLYVVQREAMLPALFVLLGLLAYLHGRERIETSPRAGIAWIVASILFATGLGTLSKANGLLFPLFVLVLEYVYLAAYSATPRAAQRCLAITAVPIAAALAIYIVYAGVAGALSGTPAFRAWSEGQRLLTEPRVLLAYLDLLLLPRPFSRGLFNDGFLPSSDWLHPWTTPLALCAVLLLPILAWRLRRRHAACAFAVLFFFAGHLLESTSIPLELYFEHRNYVPALLLFWPPALWLTRGGALARWKPVLAAGALLLLGSETYFAAELWGEPRAQALIWARQNPDSPRAQTYAAAAEREAKQFRSAETRLRAALHEHPDEVQLAINLLGVRCQIGSVSAADLDAAESALRAGSNRGPLTFDWISQSIGIAQQGSCAGFDYTTVQRLIDAARQNQQTKDRLAFQQDLLNLEGQLALARGDTADAEHKFHAALMIAPKPDVALKQAAILGTHGLPEAGLQELRYAREHVVPPKLRDVRNMEQVHRWLLYRDGYWEQEFAHLQGALEEDVAAKHAAATSTSEPMP